MSSLERDVSVNEYLASRFMRGRSRYSSETRFNYQAVEFVALALDIAIILFSSVVSGIAYHLVIFGNDGDITKYVGSALVVSALFVLTAKSRALYHPSNLLELSSQICSIAAVWIGVLLFLTGAVFFLKIGYVFSRGSTLAFALVGFTALAGERVLLRIWIASGLASGNLRSRDVVMISDERVPQGSPLMAELTRYGFKIEREFLLPSGLDNTAIEAVVGEAIEHARGSDVAAIFVSADLSRWAEREELLSRLCTLPLPVNLVPTGPIAELMKRPQRPLGGALAIELHRTPLSAVERSIKRMVDVVLAFIGLVALMPMFVLVAIAIKLDTIGPILFRQARRGFNGKPFKILKFRSMTTLEDGDTVLQASRCDKRVTRVGQWLRRTSIDELPQLINVLKGDMSIVGPRPHAVSHDSYYDQLIENYAFRHHVKPGLTGWAQVNGCRGETLTTAAMRRRVELDVWYIENWSMLFDIAIMLRTAGEIVRGRNAY